MATWGNKNKDTTTFANEQFGASLMTWNEATFEWEQASSTWDDPYSWLNQNKDTTSFSNETKH